MSKKKYIVIFYDDGRAIKTESICQEVFLKAENGDACILDISDSIPLEYHNGKWNEVSG